MIPLIDLALFGLNAYLAISNRGTVTGWVLTVVCILYAIYIVKYIRQT
jgi:hypothetical protein